jgi:hypothetical protein
LPNGTIDCDLESGTFSSTPGCTPSTQPHRHDPTGAWYLKSATWCAGFTLLALAMTYPQVTRLSTHVGLHYDALFSIWRIAWVAHQLPRDPVHLFDANIFFPESNTLAYSDATLLPALSVAPLLWLGVAPVVAYNLLVLASFATAGAAAYFLARSLGAAPIGAWFAGIVFAFQPYRFAHYPQVELLWTCWIPLALWALHRAIDTGRVKYGVLLGVFVGLQALSCLYYALFLVVALAIVAPLDAIPALRRRVIAMWKPALVAVAAAAIFIAPYMLPYQRSSAVVGLRTIDEVRNWSPTLTNYTIAQFGNRVYPSPPNEVDPFEKVLFPGITSVVAALAGLLVTRQRRAIAYAALLVVAFDLSLGSNGLLYPWLFEWVAPFRGLRVPGRMFVMVSIALAVLGAFGIAKLASIRRGRVLALALTAAALVETASVPLPLREVTPPSRAHHWLAGQPLAPVLEWPVPRAANLGVTRDPFYMYYAAAHWLPLVNGYSGNYPRSYLEFLDRIESFPDEAAIDAIVERGVRYLILHSQPDEHRFLDVVQRLTNHPRVRFQFTDNAGFEEVSVYLVGQ